MFFLMVCFGVMVKRFEKMSQHGEKVQAFADDLAIKATNILRSTEDLEGIHKWTPATNLWPHSVGPAPKSVSW